MRTCNNCESFPRSLILWDHCQRNSPFFFRTLRDLIGRIHFQIKYVAALISDQIIADVTLEYL